MTAPQPPAAGGASTRVVHFSIDPALKAYFTYLYSKHQEFDVHNYDLFAAGYRSARPLPASQAEDSTEVGG